METWDEIALRVAGQAGITTPQHELIDVAGKAVMLSRRFDRDGAIRIPFLSAMAMMGAKDDERGSYPEIVDAFAQHGAQGKTDAHALYRRVAFNVLISMSTTTSAIMVSCGWERLDGLSRRHTT